MTHLQELQLPVRLILLEASAQIAFEVAGAAGGAVARDDRTEGPERLRYKLLDRIIPFNDEAQTGHPSATVRRTGPTSASDKGRTR